MRRPDLLAARAARLTWVPEDLIFDSAPEPVTKVGPHGYDHGWIYVGVPGADGRVIPSHSMNIPRSAMPQLAGAAGPGTPAAAVAGGPGKFADLRDAFEKQLRADGIGVSRETVPAASLKATQNELAEAKVGGLAAAVRSGDAGAIRSMSKPVYISRDNYVIDGHHKWAASMLLDDGAGKREMNVRRVDMDITPALEYARNFAARMGISNRSVTEMEGAGVSKFAWLAEDAAWPDSLFKIGPHGYTHGWVFHGIPGPAERAAAGIKGSADLHRTPSGDLTPERKALHAKIVAGILAGHAPEAHPVAEFLGGGPASGKSSLIAGEKTGAHIDVDQIRRQLPEYKQMLDQGDKTAASFTHEESSEIATEARKAALANHISYLLDGTGDSSPVKMAGKLKEAKAAGYTTRAKYVTVDTDEAVRRSNERAETPGPDFGRHVPENFIRDTHKAVSNTFAGLVRDDAPDEAELWDTNGASPMLVGKKELGGKWEVRDNDAWNRFLKKGTEVSKADSGGMEPGEAAGHILRAAVDGKDFESSGVPDTPRNRDLHAKITREVQAIPAGHVVDIPWDYAADE